MSNMWKSIASLGAIVAVSVAASAVTVKIMTPKGSLDNIYESSYTSTANNHGFENNAVAISPRALGSAPDLTEAAERSVKAVVHIKVEGERSVASQGMDPFEFFFGGRPSQPQKQAVIGYGSGVIISNDGYIMTNNHVIDGSSKISVTLEDNRTFTAKLIGTDPNTDIALLKVDGKDLPTIPFGDSDKLRLGEWVLAVGNPFNLTGTVTAGIVSAKARTTTKTAGHGGLNVESFIQTDAAVNSGNSGGALVNAQGELVGINTMIFSQTGNYAGYSFAVPINIAGKVVEDIKKYGTVQRGLLGIAGSDVDADLAKKEGLKVNRGVFIGDFAEISAALAAGIEKGDVITAINGTAIEDFGRLQSEISRYRPGDTINVTVDRKGSKKTFKVTLKNKDGNERVIREQNTNSDKLKATLKALEPNQLRSYGLSYGVQVNKIQAGPLRKSGVEDGFIILTANDSPIRSIADLNKAIGEALNSRNKTLYLRGFYPNSGDVASYSIEL
ncbi:MAG: Do family serine endopeptidase [Porphyromonas sp.]